MEAKDFIRAQVVEDLASGKHPRIITLKTNPLKREHLDEFIAAYRPGKPHLRKPSWSEATPDGRWREYDYDELGKRDKTNLDIFWLKDKSLEDAANLPEPAVLAQEILDDLQSALQQFAAVASELVDKRAEQSA